MAEQRVADELGLAHAFAGQEVLVAVGLPFGFEQEAVVVRAVEFEVEIADAVHENAGAFALGMLKNLLRSADFIDDTFIHVDHAGAHIAGEVHFMRHNGHGHSLAGQGADDGEHLAHHGGIQGGGRLIEEDDFRVHREAASNGCALLLAAGKFIGHGMCLFCHADEFQQLHGLGLGFLSALAQQLYGTDAHVVQHGKVVEQVEGLEDHAHLLAQFRGVDFAVEHFLAINDDAAPGGLLQQVQAAQESALTGAGGADDGDDFALLDVQVHITQNIQIIEALLKVFDLNHRFKRWCER